MSKDFDEDNIQDVDVEFLDDEEESGVLRWLSIFVVIVTIAGFLGLAWYANNTETMGDAETVPLVTAADTNFKEAPKDPGGLQIPHQDKTIYDAISGSGNVNKPAAERVLPAPEEPVLNANGQTETWINEKLQADGVPPAENMPADAGQLAPMYTTAEPAAAPSTPLAPLPTEKAPEVAVVPAAEGTPTQPKIVTVVQTEEEAKEIAKSQDKQPLVTVVAPKVEPDIKPEVAVKAEAPAAPKPEVKVEAPKAEISKAEVKEESAKPAAAPTPSGGKAQLGAFKSEAEAEAQWSKIQSKHAVLSGKSHRVEKADLGSKGIFYRLQVLGVADGKALCDALSAAGQGCFPVKSK